MEDRAYSVVSIMARLTGMSDAEVRWTARRIVHLMRVEGKSKEKAKALVAEEAKQKPWEKEYGSRIHYPEILQ